MSKEFGHFQRYHKKGIRSRRQVMFYVITNLSARPHFKHMKISTGGGVSVIPGLFSRLVATYNIKITRIANKQYVSWDGQ